MSNAIDWIFWRMRMFMTEMRYDAAIWNKQKAARGLEESCDERFKVIYALEEQVIRQELALSEDLQVVNGAVNAYLESGDPVHKVAGEQALGRVNKHKAMIAELKLAQEEQRKGLVELRKDFVQEEVLLKGLELEKPKALADLRAAGLELMAYQRIARPMATDKTEKSIRGYRVKATARRDTNRFIQEDIYASYKSWAGDSANADVSNAQFFDDLVAKRKAGKNK